MKNHRLFAACAALFALVLTTSGCSLLAVSGDINDGSVERTSAKDHEERMARIRESGSLRPGEYDALRDKMGDGRTAEIAPKSSTAELRQRVEAARRRDAAARGEPIDE